MICPKCHGRKFVGVFRHHEYGTIKKLCSKCLGHGEVDWVQAIFGVKEDCIQIASRMKWELYGRYAFIAINPFLVVKPKNMENGCFTQLILDISGQCRGSFDFWEKREGV